MYLVHARRSCCCCFFHRFDRAWRLQERQAFALSLEKDRILKEFGLLTSKSDAFLRPRSESGVRPSSRGVSPRRSCRARPVTAPPVAAADTAALERGWIGGNIPAVERRIPSYDATKDPYCPYTRVSENFHKYERVLLFLCSGAALTRGFVSQLAVHANAAGQRPDGRIHRTKGCV
jgi:hypothetical protein